MPREDYQAGVAAEVGEGIDLLATAEAERAPAPKEKWHVRTGLDSDAKPRPRIHPIPCHALQSDERDRGVARATAESRTRGDSLLNPDADGAWEFSRSLPTRRDLVNEVSSPAWNLGVVTGNLDPSAARLKLDQKAVVDAHRLIDRPDFVIAVGTAAEDAKTKVDFCEGAELRLLLQRGRSRTAPRDRVSRVARLLTSGLLVGHPLPELVELLLELGGLLAVEVARDRAGPLLERPFPLRLRLFLLAHLEVEAAEVLVDGRVAGDPMGGLFQVKFRQVQPVHLEICPAEAVEVGAVIRLELQGLLNVFHGLIQAHAAVGEHVAEVVRGRGVQGIRGQDFLES